MVAGGVGNRAGNMMTSAVDSQGISFGLTLGNMESGKSIDIRANNVAGCAVGNRACNMVAGGVGNRAGNMVTSGVGYRAGNMITSGVGDGRSSSMVDHSRVSFRIGKCHGGHSKNNK